MNTLGVILVYIISFGFPWNALRILFPGSHTRKNRTKVAFVWMIGMFISATQYQPYNGDNPDNSFGLAMVILFLFIFFITKSILSDNNKVPEGYNSYEKISRNRKAPSNLPTNSIPVGYRDMNNPDQIIITNKNGDYNVPPDYFFPTQRDK